MYAVALPIDDPETSAVTDLDGLRLLGLSRIARCADCPRLAALREAWGHRSSLAVPWPDAPRGCRHQVCAPLVRRFVGADPGCDALRTLLD